MPHQKAVRLLTAIELMPLEDISEDAEQWREEIRAAIETLQAATMPVDDPLRYGIDGELLSLAVSVGSSRPTGRTGSLRCT